MIDAERVLVCGDAAAVPLAPKSVHCIVTSPPYWSLRRYPGSQDRPWPAGEYSPMPGVPPIPVDAWMGPLGLEPTPELFIWHLVLVFRECYRVLRDDGVLWCIIGDSFASQPQQDNHADPKAPRRTPDNRCRTSALRPGDLVGIPHRLQFALQADGWVIRNDVVWSKTNPMPESVAGWRWERCRVKVNKSERAANPYQQEAGTKQGAGVASRAQREAYYENGAGAATWRDCPGCPTCAPHGGYVLRRGSWRHTRAHETVLMCVKGMGYWSDQERVREAHARLWDENNGGSWAHASRIDDWEKGKAGTHRGQGYPLPNPAGRNPRSVLTVSSEPYPGAHYATYPTALIAPLIRATCPTRCCPVCGAGWAAVVERTGTIKRRWSNNDSATQDDNWRRDNGRDEQTLTSVINYRPTCDCGRSDWLPGRVFDPFVGSGTTLQVAKELGVRGIGLDLSHSYLDQQAKVRAQVSAPSDALDGLPMFAELGTRE